jgi:hypothetical protein
MRIHGSRNLRIYTNRLIYIPGYVNELNRITMIEIGKFTVSCNREIYFTHGIL